MAILHGTITVRRVAGLLLIWARHIAVWARCGSFFWPFVLAFRRSHSRLSSFALMATLLFTLFWSDA
jgi:hypothetical protein